jgi:hypothetical protein
MLPLRKQAAAHSDEVFIGSAAGLGGIRAGTGEGGELNGPVPVFPVSVKFFSGWALVGWPLTILTESAQMPEGHKIGDENIFCHSYASVQSPDLALAAPFFSSYEMRTLCVEVWKLAVWKKGVKGKPPQICPRNSQ